MPTFPERFKRKIEKYEFGVLPFLDDYRGVLTNRGRVIPVRNRSRRKLLLAPNIDDSQMRTDRRTNNMEQNIFQIYNGRRPLLGLVITPQQARN